MSENKQLTFSGEILAAIARGEGEIRKDAVSAIGISIGGVLTPAAAARYFTAVTDTSTFLGRVSSVMVSKIQQDIDVFNLDPRQLVRVPEGTEPTDSEQAGAENIGKRWHLKDVQLFPTINFSTIIDRARQGNIEAYLASMFARVFKNDLLILGCEGDESSGDAFKALNDGWPTLIQAAVSGTPRDVDLTNDGSGGVDWLASLDDIIAAMPAEYLVPGRTALIMSVHDRYDWARAVADKQGNNPLMISGAVPQWMGYEVIGVPTWPAKTVAFTFPENLAFGMGTEIQRNREIRYRKRCIDYTWNLYSDYAVINDKAVVWGDLVV